MGSAEVSFSSAFNGKGASDEDLFKEAPANEECLVCFVQLPLECEQVSYQACCGKLLCLGCIFAAKTAEENNMIICPFCRTPAHYTEKEYIERVKKRAEGDDAMAVYNLGCLYYDGESGLRQNTAKAHKLWLRAGELGEVRAYTSLAISYFNGRGARGMDDKKAKHYHELAAMGGQYKSRDILGDIEWDAGNFERALKHWMISARAGYDISLKAIRKAFVSGYVSKDEFEMVLRAQKESKDKTKSHQRDAANQRNEAYAFYRETGLWIDF